MEGSRTLYNINDYIMYGVTGVCQVADIKTDKFIGNVEAQYYILQPVYANNAIIMTPVNNQKILMRSLLTKEEIDEMIDNIPMIDCTWINDDRQRSLKFREVLFTGKCEEWIKLIKRLYLEQKVKAESGKSLHKVDEEVLKTAERLLFEELSVSLQIPIKKVKHYITNRIPMQSELFS